MQIRSSWRDTRGPSHGIFGYGEMAHRQYAKLSPTCYDSAPFPAKWRKYQISQWENFTHFLKKYHSLSNENTTVDALKGLTYTKEASDRFSVNSSKPVRLFPTLKPLFIMLFNLKSHNPPFCIGLLYIQALNEGCTTDLLLLTTPLYHFHRHSNLNQCFKWSLGFKSLRYLRRMSGLYWECAQLNTMSWWIDLPIIFFHRSLTPPLLGDCWLQWIGAQGGHFPGLSRLWVWSELSVHVTADSFAVKSMHCEWSPQEAR